MPSAGSVYIRDMSLSALALVVVAAFIHAYWNFLIKRAAGGPAFVWLLSLSSAAVYAPVVLVLVIFDPPQYGLLEWSLIVSSGIIHLGYALFLNHGYRVADLSVVYPVARGTGPLLATVAAILLLGERPAASGFAGVALIIAGIVCIAWPGATPAARGPGALRGVFYGVCTGLFIAAYTINDAYAVKMLAVSPILIDYFGNLVRLAFLAAPVLANPRALRDESRRNWKLALGVGTLMPVSYIMCLFAMQLAPVSYVAPARELPMLVGAYFGARLLQEGQLRQRLIGAALMIGGIVALALA
jgi:drug/metabolite transporter (DMT)-like permease